MGLTFSILAGGLSALSSLSGSMQKAQQQRYQADVAEANAQAMRRQAVVEGEKGRIKTENIDRQKEQLRRQYADVQGKNIASLGGAGVDIGSGSALDTLQGNAAGFAQDVAWNNYEKELSKWETNEAVKSANFQADQYDAQSSWLKKTAGNLGTSLFTAGLSGLGTGLSVYGMVNGWASGGGDAASAGQSFVSGSGKIMRNLRAGNLLRSGVSKSFRG